MSVLIENVSTFVCCVIQQNTPHWTIFQLQKWHEYVITIATTYQTVEWQLVVQTHSTSQAESAAATATAEADCQTLSPVPVPSLALCSAQIAVTSIASNC